MRKPRKTRISFISVKFPVKNTPKKGLQGVPLCPCEDGPLASPCRTNPWNPPKHRWEAEEPPGSGAPIDEPDTTEWDGPSPNSNRPLGWPDRFQDGWFCSNAFWMPNHSQGCQILSKRPMVGGVSPSRSNAIGLGSSDKFQDLYPVDPTCGGGANPGMNDPPL